MPKRNRTSFLWRKALPFTLILMALCVLGVQSVNSQPQLSEEKRNSVIARLTARLLENNHLRQQKIDAEISGKTFDIFLKTLDPNRMYFTALDLAEFEPAREHLGADIRDGKIEFGEKVYQRYRERFAEYREYAEELLKEGLEFASDETVQLDRQNEPWFTGREEQRDFWRRKLKNDVLYFRLMNRALELDEAAEENDEFAAIRALWDTKTPEDKVLRRLRDLGNVVDQRDKSDVLAILLTSLAQAYGPHSNYLSDKQLKQLEISMSKSLKGIGATLTSDDGYTRVVSLVPDGPAEQDGTLKPEDRIIAVAQEGGEPVDVIDMALDNVVQLIRGEPGTQVTLTILPGSQGRNAVPKTVTLTRARMDIDEGAVKGEIREVPREDGGTARVGVISFNSFYVDFQAIREGRSDFKSSSREVARVLEDMKKQGVDAVVVDLRFNSGGLLVDAIALSGLFIEDGPVLQKRESTRRVEVDQDPDPAIVYDGPLVVLTSKATASAAEILTALIRDYRRGIVAGDTRTFGKGVVSEVVNLDEKLLRQVNLSFPAGALSYEFQQFYGVDGNSNQQLGIAPDIVLPSLTEQMEIGESLAENHQPWNRIEAVEHRVYDADIKHHRDELARRSEARRAESPAYGELMQDIEKFKRIRKRSQAPVSLNEEVRFSEYLEERKLSEREEAILEQELETGAPAIKDDPVLDEAVAIAADYAELLTEQ